MAQQLSSSRAVQAPEGKLTLSWLMLIKEGFHSQLLQHTNSYPMSC
jgi:hypothetical protein